MVVKFDMLLGTEGLSIPHKIQFASKRGMPAEHFKRKTV